MKSLPLSDQLASGQTYSILSSLRIKTCPVDSDCLEAHLAKQANARQGARRWSHLGLDQAGVPAVGCDGKAAPVFSSAMLETASTLRS